LSLAFMVNKTLTPLPMRRALVLTSEAARHPFRRSHVVQRQSPPTPKEPLTDLAFFGVSFVCWFIVIMGMIA
jgi:hypothetical protein